ncbi:MAG: formyltetrahydrofolate deformylase [Alphaproteobacteria bacterium]
MTEATRIIFTTACPDVPGITAAVTTFLHEHDGFVIEAQQFGDPETCRFFMRIAFDIPLNGQTRSGLADAFQPIATKFHMEFAFHNAARKMRTMILVSKFDHCLSDLLYRWRSGTLHIDIPVIVSNHPDVGPLAEWHGIEFRHLPVSADTKPAQESQIKALCDDHGIELVVLARYMQILSPEMSAHLSGKAINIHHSFLPGFKGAAPYKRAHAHGVKLIGATAHYVTADLDEGPIIGQEIERVDHTMSAAEFVNVGRDVESLALARAVRAHSEHKVLINGRKTVVF